MIVPVPLTGHASQGATVEAAVVVGPEDFSREWAYTALSRARFEVRTVHEIVPVLVDLDGGSEASLMSRRATVTS